MQIGFSFFWQVILKLRDPNKPEVVRLAIPDIDNTLNRFAELGIQSIELKLTESTDLAQLFEAIRKLIQKGFQVTFHVPGRFRYPADLNRQLKSFAAISKFMNDEFNMIPLWVIHPLNSRIQHRSKIFAQTVDYLRQILNSMAEIPARFALEILQDDN